MSVDVAVCPLMLQYVDGFHDGRRKSHRMERTDGDVSDTKDAQTGIVIIKETCAEARLESARNENHKPKIRRGVGEGI